MTSKCHICGYTVGVSKQQVLKIHIADPYVGNCPGSAQKAVFQIKQS